MSDVFARPEILQALATIVAFVALTALAFVIGALGFRLTTKQLKTAVVFWQQAYPTIRAALDEPTDRIPFEVDVQLDKIYPFDWDRLLSLVGIAVADGINEYAKLVVAPPAVEVNPAAPPAEVVPPAEPAPMIEAVPPVEVPQPETFAQ